MQQEAPTKPGLGARFAVDRATVIARARWVALLLLIVGTIGGALFYWRYSTIYPSTDNAYTGTHIVRVSADVAGPVVRLYVRNNEFMRAGDPLFDIDPAPYDAALREARAQFDRAAQAAGNDANALREAADKLEDARRALVDARLAYQRARDVRADGEDRSEELIATEEAWREALTAFAAARQEFGKAQDADLRIVPATVALRSAAAALDRAIHDRARTHVSAPADGWVSDLSLRPGTTVGAGTPLFALIEGSNWWVDANFKETDIARIRVGQPATVQLDMYPGVTFDGEVDSISAGSGAVFSVLPPENATGNWVKVTQRFTVRVAIVNPSPADDRPLRVGASASVTIDTSSLGTQ